MMNLIHNKLIRFVLVPIGLFLAVTQGFSAELPQEEALAHLEYFKVAPKMCIKQSADVPCELELKLEVRFDQPTDFCVVADNFQLNICLDAQKNYQYEQALQASSNIEVQLTTKEGTLFRTVKVAAYEKAKETRKMRLRRNLGWVY